MKTTNKNLITNLVGVNEIKEDEITRIGIYPCTSCQCGSVILWLGHSGSEHPILNIDLDLQSVKIATDVYNYLNSHQPPMTPKNFLTFLNILFVE